MQRTTPLKSICLIALTLLLPVGIAHGQSGQDANGWTILNMPTSRVYVSSSEGNDSNPGTLASPVQTLNRAIQLTPFEQHHAILLKKGDTWNESFGNVNRHGAGAQQPLIFTSYGEGDRPRVVSGNDFGLAFNSSGASPYTGIVVKGLHFDASGRDENLAANHAGIFFNMSGNGIIVEDNQFEGYAVNVVLQNSKAGETLSDVQFRRNIVVDAYRENSAPGSPGTSQGLFVANASNILIEQNLFDRNGFNPDVADAVPTIYNHNVYIQSNTADVILRENIIARGSAHGAQARSGGLIEKNIFIENSIALLVGSAAVNPDVFDNVSIAASLRTHEDGLFRGHGISTDASLAARVIRNLLLHSPLGASNPLNTGADDFLVDNVIYKWGAYSDPDPGTWPDPERTIATYDQFIGGAGSIESFLAEARLNSADNWNLDYTADPMVLYFQQGFGIIPEPTTAALLALLSLSLLRRTRPR